MHKWALITAAAFILGGACKMQDDDKDLSNFGCGDTVTSCRLRYSAFNGYQRSCSTRCEDEAPGEASASGSVSPPTRADDGGEAPAAGSTPAAAAAAAAGGAELGPATPLDVRRYTAFDIRCTRDNQCGPGKCVDGSCYYGCQSDEQCGSGDRCSQESGARVCQPDPNPPVACTRSAQCSDGFVCLNGGCRQECSSTDQCTNLLDRCGSGVCVPDRRPIAECVLNSECATGEVCLDGACVGACPDGADAGACLAEPPPALGAVPAPSASEAPSSQPAEEASSPPAEEPTESTEPDETSEDEPAPTDAGVAPQSDIR